jgi:hypothetical protein
MYLACEKKEKDATYIMVHHAKKKNERKSML